MAPLTEHSVSSSLRQTSILRMDNIMNPLYLLACLCILYQSLLSFTSVQALPFGAQFTYPCAQTDGETYGHIINGLTYEYYKAQQPNNAFSVTPSSSVYRPGTPVLFEVVAINPDVYTVDGYMFQAFNSKNERVGYWLSLSDPTIVTAIYTACATDTANTIMQATTMTAPSMTLQWTPPDDFGVGAVRVVATLLAAYELHWIHTVWLAEDTTAHAPDDITTFVVDEAFVKFNSASRTYQSTVILNWMAPFPGNGSATLESYTIQAVDVANPDRTFIRNVDVDSADLVNNADGSLQYTLSNVLLSNHTYSISLSAMNSYGLNSSLTAYPIVLSIPTDDSIPIEPTNPIVLQVTFTQMSTMNSDSGNMITTGSGGGFAATITAELLEEVAAPLQILKIEVYTWHSAGIIPLIQTYYAPNIPPADNSTFALTTFTVDGLFANSGYNFQLKMYTTNNMILSSKLVKNATPGCLNGCSGNGICQPLLAVCHCSSGFVGADCSIPLTQNYLCGSDAFSSSYGKQDLCINWVLVFDNTGYNGMIYWRISGNLDGGYFAMMWGASMDDGMNGGLGFSVFVNPDTNETMIQAVGGNPGLTPASNAISTSTSGAIGFYESANGTSDIQFWQSMVDETGNLANQYPFYNITAGVGQFWYTSWCRGGGVFNIHSVHNRGKLKLYLADYMIQQVGSQPDFALAYSPFIVIISIIAVFAGVYQYSSRVKALFNPLFHSLAPTFSKHLVPPTFTSYFLLPPDQFFMPPRNRAERQQQKLPAILYRHVGRWAVSIFDFFSMSARKAVGELQFADLLVAAVYGLLLIAFITNFQALYSAIAYSPDSRFVYGHVVLWHISLLVIPITKRSVLLLLFNIPFERALKYHRWLGKLLLMWIGVHFFTQTNYYYDRLNTIQAQDRPSIINYYTLTNDTPYGGGNLYGFLSFFVALFMFLTSVEIVRRHFFSMFYLSHVIGFPTFFTLAQLHNNWVYYFFLPGAFFYVIDHVWRWIGILKMSGRIKTLEYLKDEQKLVRQSARLDVTLPDDQRSKLNAGQYCFVCIPSLSLVWHPFTVSSSPYELSIDESGQVVGRKSRSKQISFHVLSMGPLTFTDRLVKLARTFQDDDLDTPEKLPYMLIDGPYSNWSVNINEFSHLMIVAGGIGITPFFSLLSELVYKYYLYGKDNHREVPLKSICVVWISRTASSFYQWNSELLEVLFKLPTLVQVHLFESRASLDRDYGFELMNMKKARSASSLFSNPELAANTPNVPPPAKRPSKKYAAQTTQPIVLTDSTATGTGTVAASSEERTRALSGDDAKSAVTSGRTSAAETAAEPRKAKKSGATDEEEKGGRKTKGVQFEDEEEAKQLVLPVNKGRPDWKKLFDEYAAHVNAASAQQTPSVSPSSSSNAAVLVCGPSGVVAAVQEHAGIKGWPLHREQFFL